MRASVITRIALVACLSLTACGGSKSADSTAQQQEALAPQKGQVWQLVAVRGKAVNRQAEPVTLVFNPEAKTVSGRTTCNNYYGSYRLMLKSQMTDGDHYTLKIREVGSTKVYCNEADMNAESRYLALLPKADAMTIDAYTLTLYQRGKEILKYELQ